MDETDKIIIKEQIISDIEALKKQIKLLEEKAKPMLPDCSQCDLERSETLIEVELMHKILNGSRIRLAKLENALSQINSPEFGICIVCENDIPLERMKIRPESIRCVACENAKRN
ncbi:MAG: TraR/DksA C4-type zinc finger protein [Sulfurovaceae bacterium]|nr:TraR/DksA C4-type zinc finger protein [Sulfurovaceae bacterium]